MESSLKSIARTVNSQVITPFKIRQLFIFVVYELIDLPFYAQHLVGCASKFPRN